MLSIKESPEGDWNEDSKIVEPAKISFQLKNPRKGTETPQASPILPFWGSFQLKNPRKGTETASTPLSSR